MCRIVWSTVVGWAFSCAVLAADARQVCWCSRRPLVSVNGWRVRAEAQRCAT